MNVNTVHDVRCDVNKPNNTGSIVCLLNFIQDFFKLNAFVISDLFCVKALCFCGQFCFHNSLCLCNFCHFSCTYMNSPPSLHVCVYLCSHVLPSLLCLCVIL